MWRPGLAILRDGSILVLLLLALQPTQSSARLGMRGLFNEKFDWDIRPVEGFPTLSFNSTDDNEMEFQYLYTGSLGAQNYGSVKYLHFELLEYDCDLTKPVDLSVMNFTEASGQPLSRILQASEEDPSQLLRLYLDIDKSTVADSPYYQDGPDAKTAYIKFCVRGDYMYDDDGDAITRDDSINYHETQVTITIDLTAGFELVALDIVRDAAAEAQANVACRVQAYFCTDNRQPISPPYLQQGMPLQFCVEIAEEDRGRFWLRDIVGTQLDQDNDEGALFRNPNSDEWDDIIVNFNPDPLTEKVCQDGICRVKTQLKSKYFATRFPNPLDIFGTGLCALGSAVEGLHGKDIPLASSRTSIVASEGFDCGNETMFTLNRLDDTTEYPLLMVDDSSGSDDQCFLRLTPDERGWRASSAFMEFSFFESNPKRTFEMSAGYRIYGDADGSADGMAFVIHADPRGENALGKAGGAMGVYDGSGEDTIRSAIVVEFDTHPNPEFFDQGQNRVHIIQIQEDGTMVELAETGLLPLRTSSDGLSSGRIWIEYCDDQILRVYLNGQGDDKPLFPAAFVQIDLESFFVNETAYLGFVAGTAALGDNHDVLDLTMSQNFDQCQSIPTVASETEIVALTRTGIDSIDGFPCNRMLFTINRGTNPVDLVFPSYVPIDGQGKRCFLRMTPDSVSPRASSAFLDFRFNPQNTEKSFSMSIGYRIYGEKAGSADGLAFVMHQDERGKYAIGEPGGAIGAYGTQYNRDGATSAISPAIVIEWDTHPNPEYLDNGQNRIHIVMVDANGNMTELAETEELPIRSDASGNPGRMWVDYCNGIMQVFINTAGDEKPAEPQASASVSLADHFTGNDVVVGYTSGTWSQADYHDIFDWEMVQSNKGCMTL